MRLFRRFLVVVSGTAAATIAVMTVAMALDLRRPASFSGPSGHSRYEITLQPECFTTGCRAATAVSVQLTTVATGPACPRGTFQLPASQLSTGTFATSARLPAAGRELQVTVSGRFTTTGSVQGTVTGPPPCAGSDSYRLVSSSL